MSKLEQLGATLLRNSDGLKLEFESNHNADGGRDERLSFTVEGMIFKQDAREALIDLALLKTVIGNEEEDGQAGDTE